MHELLQQGFIGLAIVLVIYYLIKRREDKPSVDQHAEHLMRMKGAYLVCGSTMIIIGFAVLTIPLFIEDVFSICLIAVLVLFGFGIPSYLLGKNHYLKFNDVMIESRGLFGKMHYICWTDVITIRFNRLTGTLIIKDVNHRTIKVHKHLVGLRTYTQAIESHCELKLSDLKLPAF